MDQVKKYKILYWGTLVVFSFFVLALLVRGWGIARVVWVCETKYKSYDIAWLCDPAQTHDYIINWFMLLIVPSIIFGVGTFYLHKKYKAAQRETLISKS